MISWVAFATENPTILETISDHEIKELNSIISA